MWNALDKVEREIGMSLIEHAIRCGFSNQKFLPLILKKFYPDLRSIETKVSQDLHITGSLDLPEVLVSGLPKPPE